jgi:hypothetical protein
MGKGALGYAKNTAHIPRRAHHRFSLTSGFKETRTQENMLALRTKNQRG